jgi:hypothetical protein
MVLHLLAAMRVVGLVRDRGVLKPDLIQPLKEDDCFLVLGQNRRLEKEMPFFICLTPPPL